MAGFIGKKASAPVAIAVTVTDPERTFTLDTGGVSVLPAGADTTTASLALPAEAFIRLLSGRIGDGAELKASGVTLADLKSVFPGF
jgi:hypothetical protein